MTKKMTKEALQERQRCIGLVAELRDITEATRVGFSRKKALSQLDLLVMHINLGTQPAQGYHPLEKDKEK